MVGVQIVLAWEKMGLAYFIYYECKDRMKGSLLGWRHQYKGKGEV